MGLFKKCVSFTGDNCNTNFGGLTRPKGNNVFSRLKNGLPGLVGVGCPAHILNNCSHHVTNQMTIDVESIIDKTNQYFCTYTVRTEELKDYCNFVDTEYRKLLSHSVTRWLSLYPSLSRMLQMYLVFHVIQQATNCFETILWSPFEWTILETHAIIYRCFQWTSSKYWTVKSIDW